MDGTMSLAETRLTWKRFEESRGNTLDVVEYIADSIRNGDIGDARTALPVLSDALDVLASRKADVVEPLDATAGRR